MFDFILFRNWGAPLLACALLLPAAPAASAELPPRPPANYDTTPKTKFDPTADLDISDASEKQMQAFIDMLRDKREWPAGMQKPSIKAVRIGEKFRLSFTFEQNSVPVDFKKIASASGLFAGDMLRWHAQISGVFITVESHPAVTLVIPLDAAQALSSAFQTPAANAERLSALNDFIESIEHKNNLKIH